MCYQFKTRLAAHLNFTVNSCICLISVLSLSLICCDMTLNRRRERHCQSRPVSGNHRFFRYADIAICVGSGKTTLLNYLSGKDPSKNLANHGQILANGVDRDKVDFSRYVGYVQQEDILMQTLTVKECLTFAAKMKLPPKSKHSEIVDRLIVSLGLQKAADTKIGGPLVKGVSGGERKRTSIGVELITEPSIVFLDEPTTGLDSFTAQKVVEVLENLAMSGRTVLCTIHQPSSEVFSQFDQLMLMVQGRIIYMNHASKALDYFSSIGYPWPKKKHKSCRVLYGNNEHRKVRVRHQPSRRSA